MYFAFKSGGWSRQRLLWDLVNDGLLNFHAPTELEVERMQFLMEQYHDTPMDMADASLVAAAEALGEKRIFRSIAISTSTSGTEENRSRLYLSPYYSP